MGPYRYQACHVDTDVVYTNNGYTGAFRGFGNTEVTACIEQAVDELAEKLNLDPLEFRLQNCLRPLDTDRRTASRLETTWPWRNAWKRCARFRTGTASGPSIRTLRRIQSAREKSGAGSG